MPNVFKNIKDIESYISDMPLDGPEQYKENVIEIVATEFRNFLENISYKWGDEVEISEEQFWKFFEAAELDD